MIGIVVFWSFFNKAVPLDGLLDKFEELFSIEITILIIIILLPDCIDVVFEDVINVGSLGLENDAWGIIIWWCKSNRGQRCTLITIS